MSEFAGSFRGYRLGKSKAAKTFANCRSHCGTIVIFFSRRGIGLLVSTLIAFLNPKTYVSTSQLMPADRQSTLASAIVVGARQ